MAFKEPKPPHIHVRCPCCGRLSRLAQGQDVTTLPRNFAVDHDLSLRVQSFVGNGRHGGQGYGFVWSDQAPSSELRARLRRLLQALIDRLDD